MCQTRILYRCFQVLILSPNPSQSPRPQPIAEPEPKSESESEGKIETKEERFRVNSVVKYNPRYDAPIEGGFVFNCFCGLITYYQTVEEMSEAIYNHLTALPQDRTQDEEAHNDFLANYARDMFNRTMDIFLTGQVEHKEAIDVPCLKENGKYVALLTPEHSLKRDMYKSCEFGIYDDGGKLTCQIWC